MATLYLDHTNRYLPSLREWLAGYWGLLLSDPSDFEECGQKRGRWLEIVRDKFRTSGVKPIACRCADGAPDRGWVSTLTEDERPVRLSHSDVIDIAARHLRDQITDMPTPRFAMVVDPTLLCHIALMYQPDTRRIELSPLDLLDSIDKLRRQSAGRGTGPWPRRAA